MKSMRGPQLTSSDLTFDSDLAGDIFTNKTDNPIDLLDYCPRSRKHNAELDLKKKLMHPIMVGI